MRIAHRIALDPNNKQATLFRQHAGYARYVWNWGVEESRRALAAGETGAVRHQRLRPLFNRVKADLAPWSGLLSQNAAKYALTALGEAWQSFFARRPDINRPQFKSRKHSKTAFRADNGPGTVRVCERTVRFPKIGRVPMREACRFTGPVRECTVVHDGTRWYASVVCDLALPEPREVGDVVGVDVGLRRLATVYDGAEPDVVPNPRPLKKALSKLRTVNRQLARSRKIHGEKRRSKRRERLYGELRRLHVRVSHLRLDAAHKATTAIAKRSRLVCVESLSVKGWMRNRKLSRSTADTAPGRFLSLLKWKCESGKASGL